MRTRTKILLIAVPIVLIFLAPIVFWAAVAGGSSDGSPELAAEWRNELAAYETPLDVPLTDSTIEHVKFKNGDWLIGRAQDSHGMWRRGGGTVVLKDSNGEIHAFFGHVCGGSFISWGFGEHPDLQSFYACLAERSFREYRFE